MNRQHMRVGGELRAGSESEVIHSPFDGQAVGEVALAVDSDMDDAISIAHESIGLMRELPTHRRAAILEGVAAELTRREAELATLMARESGKPIRYCRGEVTRAALTFTLAAGESRRFGGEVLPIDLEARAEGRLCLFTRVPRGPVAAISPFNFPLNLIAHKLAPALAIGAPVVLKPPPQCPLSGHVLGEIMHAAGLPAGGLSVLHCSPTTAQRMVEDPRMKVLSFTGSDAVGWRLKSLSGKKQVLLELGGNAPCVVDAGVDLAAILPSIVQGAWANAGQVCIKVQRLYVHASVYDDFMERFVRATRELVCGDPLDEATVVGPLIEKKHVERVLAWIDEAQSGGAKKHCGGEARGQVVLPTVLTHVKADMKVCSEEVFGPVTVVERFENFDQALQMCNQGRFGLQAGIFTRDLSHALQAFRELDYGGVLINDVPTFRVDNFPYGGTRDSGLGREGVRFSMEEMSEPKVLILRGL
jgi:glyceraldehyde-3-phosphate dehydrogenase (NADP+)